MQTLQQPQLLSKQNSPQFDFTDCNHSSVSDFLNHCHLNQYLDIFLSEGFDSITSLLEITEEDMIFMNVKRGHRRLIQREIATTKGLPRDQPFVTNTMVTKYPTDAMTSAAKIPIINNNSSYNTSNTPSKPVSNSLTNYDSNPTGLASPRSMNSGIGSNSGSSSSSGVNFTLRSRSPPEQSPRANDLENSVSSSNTSGADNNTNLRGGMSDNRSSSISSNDDGDSVDTNESAPTKRKYRRHAKPDRHAPVKPPSAYIMFSNDARAELKNQNLSFAELAKIVGDQWKNLSHIQKQAYERMAMRAKDEYLASLEQYRQTPNYTRYQEYLNDFKTKQDAANRLIGRARKRAKQASPGSGSIADSSSNGNSNSSGSSGSGFADAYGDKESVIRRQRRPSDQELSGSDANYNYNTDKSGHPNSHSNSLRPTQQQQQSSDSGYTSQTYYNKPDKSAVPQWNYRSNQIMRGMLPVEFTHSTPNAEQSPQQTKFSSASKDLGREVEDEEDNAKRCIPRFSEPISEPA